MRRLFCRSTGPLSSPRVAVFTYRTSPRQYGKYSSWKLMAKSVYLVIEWWVEMIRINLWSSNNALNSHPTSSVSLLHGGIENKGGTFNYCTTVADKSQPLIFSSLICHLCSIHLRVRDHDLRWHKLRLQLSWRVHTLHCVTYSIWWTGPRIFYPTRTVRPISQPWHSWRLCHVFHLVCRWRRLHSDRPSSNSPC